MTEDDIPQGTKLVPKWYRVLYEKQEHERLLEELLRYVLVEPDSEQALSALMVNVACIKNRGFKEEQEARFIAVRPNEDAVSFRPGGGSQIVPYIKLASGPHEDEIPILFNIHPELVQGLPIQEVKIGPGGTESFIGVKRFLDTYGYGETPITFSTVSYRG